MVHIADRHCASIAGIQHDVPCLAQAAVCLTKEDADAIVRSGSDQVIASITIDIGKRHFIGA